MSSVSPPSLTSKICCVCNEPAECQCPCGSKRFYCSTECQYSDNASGLCTQSYHWNEVHRYDPVHCGRSQDSKEEYGSPQNEAYVQPNESRDNLEGQTYQRGSDLDEPSVLQQKLAAIARNRNGERDMSSEPGRGSDTERLQQDNVGDSIADTQAATDKTRRNVHEQTDREMFLSDKEEEIAPGDETSDGPPDLIDFDGAYTSATVMRRREDGLASPMSDADRRTQLPKENSDNRLSESSRHKHVKGAEHWVMSTWTCCGKTHKTGPQIISHAVSHATNWAPMAEARDGLTRKERGNNIAQTRLLSKLKTDLVGAEADGVHTANVAGGRSRKARRAYRYNVAPRSRLISTNDVDGQTNHIVAETNHTVAETNAGAVDHANDNEDTARSLRNGRIHSNSDVVVNDAEEPLSSRPGSPQLVSLLKHSCSNTGCEKKFGTMSDLKIHSRVCDFAEADERPNKKSVSAKLACNRCNRLFTRPVNLSQHVRSCDGLGARKIKSKRDHKRENRSRSRARKREKRANALPSSSLTNEADGEHMKEDQEDSEDRWFTVEPYFSEDQYTVDEQAYEKDLEALTKVTSIKVTSPQPPSPPQPVQSYTTRPSNEEKLLTVCSWPNCGKTFSRPSDLKKHYYRHTANYPFPCPVEGCSMSYQASGSLTVHLRTHKMDAEGRYV
ncbi:hypothetical protein SARC_05051 [Sphaeroforma arctica JP610]|uniref:C2H2-type domain-containing protein n=1 Tax=Sphaeroforma arctica JP610 TaxID=667725 RepID=A0A0L0G1G6_9EUKA|nr:hypothetical protein SARC_05051 [Sphaeroforma arctica JP610]KNC82674.1 hypothetical protein SARC_05051 [Sphaeroforma arctica JP610]|eukprot:XP_014156576.1 hypothetical protein SARC_05051 [Sphaeroforma arctica JP610]